MPHAMIASNATVSPTTRSIDCKKKLLGPDRRQRLDAKVKEDKRLAAIEFDRVDADRSGQIDLQQFKQVLTKVNNGKELDTAAWNFIVMSLKADAYAEAADQSSARKDSSAPCAAETDGIGSGEIELGMEPCVKITQAAALLAVTKYSYYIVHNQDVDKIFTKFDKDKSGDWDRNELKRAMFFCENESGMKRIAAGMVLDISVFDEDVTFVLDKLGFPANGRVDGSHAQQALATWHACADKKFEKQSKCCCVIS